MWNLCGGGWAELGLQALSLNDVTQPNIGSYFKNRCTHRQGSRSVTHPWTCFTAKITNLTAMRECPSEVPVWHRIHCRQSVGHIRVQPHLHGVTCTGCSRCTLHALQPRKSCTSKPKPLILCSSCISPPRVMGPHTTPCSHWCVEGSASCDSQPVLLSPHGLCQPPMLG